MKELTELNFPDDLRYAESHEWARTEGDRVKVGITDYAQDSLGDIVFIELPEPGKEVKRGEVIAVVESVKSVSDVYSPVSGTVLEVNEKIEGDPELINKSPFDEGWLFKIKTSDDVEDLMDSSEYMDYIS